MNDAKALRALQKGSEDALSWIIDRYSAYVYTVAFHIVGQSMSSADAEDVAADVFAALWNHAGKIKPSSLKSWLGTVARNTAKNKLPQSFHWCCGSLYYPLVMSVVRLESNLHLKCIGRHGLPAGNSENAQGHYISGLVFTQLINKFY